MLVSKEAFILIQELSMHSSFSKMDQRIHLQLLVIFIQVLVIAALVTNPQDAAALKALRDEWENVPPNWEGSDPCGNSWEGISCKNSRVTSITLPGVGLSGTLPGDIVDLGKLETLDLSNNKELTGSLPHSIGNLKELTYLILVGCGFSGPIPESIGSLQKLVVLSLNSNSFIRQIPASIGNLSKLIVLDIADNKLDGSIPVSNGSSPGLDMLLSTRHFHFGRNQLSGEIPAGLFNSNMALIHLLLESNQLEGSIPDTLGLLQNLEVVRLENNILNGPVPTSLNNLIHVRELCLSNNTLTGPLPNLTGMSDLNYVDMSNNSFAPSDVPPWFSTLESLETLLMESTQIKGELPVRFFSLPLLQTVILRNNRLNGTLNIQPSRSNKLQLVDLRNNVVDDVSPSAVDSVQTLILRGNPICLERVQDQYPYCIAPQPSGNTYSTPPCNGSHPQCSSGQVPSPTCKCAYPYTGNLYSRANFSYFENTSNYAILQQSIMNTFQASQLPVDSISVSTPPKNLDSYPALHLHLQIFPSGQDHFNRTAIIAIGFELRTQTFGGLSAYFIHDEYKYFDEEMSKSSRIGIIIGAAVGGSVLVILLLLAGVYSFHQKKRAEIASRRSDPFASWGRNKNNGGALQLKHAEHFSFEALKKCTNYFSEINDIGSGGYGKVYKGILPSGQLVAIKRARQGSIEHSLQFRTEIELLSRVHHKNLVSLVGFCFEQGEQLLVYEYMSNGSLKDSLLGKSGIRLDWARRLRIALGAAKGLQYLHDLANPPIIHRDIKSNNILLDEYLNAKVADFGLSKLAGEPEKGHVTTQVKGTMGYLDPEYYMTQQLTEKSDVYSFGVLLLELITARKPIEKGMYIAREVEQTMDRTKELYNLHGILDPLVCSSGPPRSLEKFVDLALRCVAEGVHRPTMSEVVKEIENIMEVAGLNPNVDSASTSASHEGAGKNYHPYSNESLFSHSGVF